MKTLNKYSITVPTAHDMPRKAVPLLLKAFGGFTQYEAQGAWESDDGQLYYEPVIKFDIATSKSESEAFECLLPVMQLMFNHGELAVYFETPQGAIICNAQELALVA